MVAYVFVNNGIPIFDATRAVITLNSTGQPVDHIVNVVTITTSDGFPNYGASPPRAIPQLVITIKISALVYFVTSQALRTHQAPDMTPKFGHNPGCVNRKIINYKTKAGKVLYKRAIRSLYSDSEGNFALTSEVLLSFSRLLTGHLKSCSWKNFTYLFQLMDP